MVSNDLGACEWFVWDLRRSGLIDRGQLDQVIGEFLKRNPRAEPPALAEYLVGQEVLSPFQAERILQGKTQGLVLGPYVLVDSIGQGSMGQVFKATSKTDNQWYAVKVLPRRSMWNVRLARRQVRAFSQFTHPAVVPFVDVGTSGGLHYLVWPLAEGETLEARVQRAGRLSPNEAAQVGAQVAQGLTVCHQNGIFHGLIKPSNIMLGNDHQTRLLDFGIGSLLVENEGESLVDTMSTSNALTSGLDCASPESIMEPTNRTPAGDQYSLGCVLYYCLSGQYPFPDGTAVEKMMAHQFKPAPPLRELVPGLPEGLVSVVEKLMQKAPDSRYSGADEVVEALQSFASAPVQRPQSNPGRIAPNAPTPRTTTPRTAPPELAPTPATAPPLGRATSFPTPVPPAPPSRTTTPLPGSQPRPATRLGTAPPTTAHRTAPATGAHPQRPPLGGGSPPHPVPSTPLPPPAPNRSAPSSGRGSSLPEALPLPPTPIPPAHDAETPAPPRRHRHDGAAPGWVNEEPRSVGLGLVLIVVLAVAVFAGVLFLGKNVFGQ